MESEYAIAACPRFAPNKGQKLLSASFYAADAPDVARGLIGAVLVHRTPRGDVFGRIVETEAYDATDPASHSYRGMTPRTTVMFGPGGRAYVYRSYGLHWCINVSCAAKGFGAAVLIRAVEPLGGQQLMSMARKLDSASPERLCRGPGNVTQAFGIHHAHDGQSMRGPSLKLYSGQPLGDDEYIEAGPRIGISVATEVAWRFYIAGCPYVSARRGRKLSASRRA